MRLALIFFVIIINIHTFATGWPQKKDRGYIQVYTLYNNVTQFYGNDGTKIDIPDMSDLALTLYGEYGITDRLTGVVSLPFFRTLSINAEQLPLQSEDPSNSGVSDGEAGFRYLLWQEGSTVVSGVLMAGLPFGDNTDENKLYTGDGEWNQIIGLQAGHSFSPQLFIAGETAFNNRTEGYNDEFRWAFEAGYFPVEQLLIMLKLNGIEPFDNGTDSYIGGYAGLYANQQRYIAFGPEVSYFFSEQIGINAAVISGTRTRNIGSALTIKAGFFFQW